MFHFQPAMDPYPFCEPSFPQPPNLRCLRREKTALSGLANLAFLSCISIQLLSLCWFQGELYFYYVTFSVASYLCLYWSWQRPALSWKGVQLGPLWIITCCCSDWSCGFTQLPVAGRCFSSLAFSHLHSHWLPGFTPYTHFLQSGQEQVMADFAPTEMYVELCAGCVTSRPCPKMNLMRY